MILSVMLACFKFSFFLFTTVLCLGCAAAPPPLPMLGTWHTVQEGDTVAQVAATYRVLPVTLAELNDLQVEGPISGRREIFVPLNAGLPPGDGTPPKIRRDQSPATPDPGLAAPLVSKCKQEERACYAWPAKGTVTRAFSTDEPHHDGLDITAAEGSPILAAEDGQVLYSGDAIKGYGNLVLVRHPDRNITVYAHNRRNVVEEGQSVRRGEKIAEMGRSGAAPTVHLHFEIRSGETPVDPMLYLSENGE